MVRQEFSDFKTVYGTTLLRLVLFSRATGFVQIQRVEHLLIDDSSIPDNILKSFQMLTSNSRIFKITLYTNFLESEFYILWRDHKMATTAYICAYFAAMSIIYQ